MEVNLSLISEDFLDIPISHKTEQILNKLKDQKDDIKTKNESIGKIIKEEIKNNYIFLKNIEKEEYFDVKIYKNNIENNNAFTHIIGVNSKDKLKEEIENKINLCMEKEKILVKKQEEIKKINENMIINENLLEKKLLSLLEINKEEYEKLLNLIIEQILDYDYFVNDVKKVQELIIKYRESLIIARFFRIWTGNLHKIFKYIVSKSVIFLNNIKLFKILNCLLLKISNKIIDGIYEDIFEKISVNEIFKNKKEEYVQKINFYKEICYLFPILKYFDKSQDKEIYELEEDIHLEYSENIFDEILSVNSEIPKRNGLNITLEYLKEHTNIEQAYEMSLKRILLIYQKYKILPPIFKLSSFLYE